MSAWFSRLSLSLFFFSLLIMPLLAQDIPANAADLAEDLTAAADAPEAAQNPTLHPALRLADQLSEVHLGTLQDREHRPFTVKLVNVSQGVLQVPSVRSTCPCLLIEQSPAPATLQPGGEFLINATLRANMLAVGKFSRVIMIEVQDFDPLFVKVAGDIDTNVTFEPAPVIDLGNLVGLVTNWERTIKLQFQFPNDQQIQVHQPEENKYFNLALSSPAANTFAVTATPKLPLPPGRLSEIISLPTSGVENYGPVQIAFRGTVTGWELTVQENNLIIDTNKTEPGKPHLAELIIVPTSEATGRNPIARRRFLSHSHNTKKDSRVSEQHVNKEESNDNALKNIDTWKNIAEKVVLNLPEKCSWEIIPENEGLKIKLSFPNDFFQQRSRFTGTLQLEKKLVGRINIIGKK